MSDETIESSQISKSSLDPRSLTDAEVQKLSELDEQIAKFEGQKRWSDAIKGILAKAEIVTDPATKIELLTQAGTLYIERSANQAEAIKCFEMVLEIDPTNARAITQLKDMYEKRRDWEKLIRTMERETALLDESVRGAKYLEMAQLAADKLRKPDINTALWAKVLEFHPGHPDALNALSALYERSREWQPLAEVLEQQVENATIEEAKALYAKLGMIYADKLNNDRSALEAFSRLLELDPEDKRAQEQLKRRYIAAKAWDELERFYAPTGKWEELIRTLEREALNKDTAKEEQVELFFRIARLWNEQEKNDRAIKAYEKVLEIDPENHEAALALSPVYEAASDAKKLANVYEVRLKHDDEPTSRIVLLDALTRLYEEKLKRPEDAFARALSAFQIDPTQSELRVSAKRLAGVTKDWNALIGAYQAALSDVTDAETTLNLRVDLAETLLANERFDEAVEQAEELRAQAPDSELVLRTLESVYRGAGRSRDLLDVVQARLDLSLDEAERKNLSYTYARLVELEVKDDEEAIAAYRRILAEWGDQETAAYAALEGIYEKLERNEDLADTFERRIEAGPESLEELAALKFRLALVRDQKLNDRATALELLREVVTILPEHDGAVAVLESILSDKKHGATAALILEPTYEFRGAHPQLIRALEILVERSSDSSEQVTRLKQIAEIAETKQNDSNLAFDAYSRALAKAPSDQDVIQELLRLSGQESRFAAFYDLLSKVANDESEREEGEAVHARALHFLAARIAEEQLEKHELAIASYRAALELDPSDLEAILGLEALYRAGGQSDLLAAVLRRKAELIFDENERQAVLSSLADVYETQLNNPTAAISVHREILELIPDSEGALLSLERLFEKQSAYSDLADTVARRLSLSSDPEQQVSLMLRMAELRQNRMSEPVSAIEIYRDVLDRDPANETAIAALESWLADETHQASAADILETAYQKTSRYSDLIRVLETQVALATSKGQRLELLNRMAELYEVGLDDAPQVFAVYQRSLAEEPSDAFVREQLERLAAQLNAFPQLANTLEQRAEELARADSFDLDGADSRDLNNLDVVSDLLARSAQIHDEEMGDIDGAIRLHHRVLALNPASLDSASALEALYLRTEKWAELASILLVKADLLDLPDEKKDVLYQASRLFEEMIGEPEKAVPVYESILSIDAEELPALDKLVELHLRADRFEPLLEVYRRKAEVVVDPLEKKRILLEQGAVFERELNDKERAIGAYQRILEVDPDDYVALGRLDSLYEATGQHRELLAVLEHEADLARDPNDIASYKYRIGELLHHRLGDPRGAVDSYRAVLEILPDHEPTFASLEEMTLENDKEPREAALVLESSYSQIGDHPKLVRALETQLRHETGSSERLDLLHRIGMLAEVQLNDSAAAFNAFARAVQTDSSDLHSLESLERFAGELNRFDDVGKLYDEQLAALPEDEADRKVELGLRTAQIYESHLGDVEKAIARYNAVLALDESQIDALSALDRLYEATANYSALSGILERELTVASSPDDLLSLQYRLGRVAETHLADMPRAIGHYRDILSAVPEHAPALGALEQLFARNVEPLAIAEILEPLYRMQESWQSLLSVYEVQLAHLRDPNERVSMMHRLADTAEDRASSPETAAIWHQRVLLESPENEFSFAESERLAGGLGEWQSLADTLSRAIQVAADAAQKADLGRKLARIYEEELNDSRAAIETHLYVLSVDATDETTLAALDRLYSEAQAGEALVLILKARTEVTRDLRDKVDFVYRRAEVLDLWLNRPDEAIPLYASILQDLDREHESSIHALARIYGSKEAWPELYQTYERELDVVLGDVARADVFAKMARLASDRLSNETLAVELWNKVLDVRGEDAEALNALGDLHARAERWTDLADVLDRESAVVVSDDARARIFADLGRLWFGRLNNERNALDNWQRVLDVDPSNVEALFARAEIHRAAGHVHEEIEALHQVAEVGAGLLDAHTLETVFIELAKKYTSLDQPADAVEAYGRALDVAPENFAVLDALQSIHVEQENWEEVIGVKERRVAVLPDDSSRIAGLLDIADDWSNRTNRAVEGVSALLRVIEVSPLHRAAFDRLVVLYTNAGRFEDLVELYLARVENEPDVKERVKLLRKVAQVQEVELGDREQAFGALQIAWEEDFTDRQTVLELERVTGLAQKWNELLAFANEASQQATDTNIKISILLACARWYGTQLRRLDWAISCCNEVLRIDPVNGPAMQQMADLYRGAQQWEPLAQVLTRLIETSAEATYKSEGYAQLGELYEHQLGSFEQAHQHYLLARDSDPRNLHALNSLERTFRVRQEWTALLEVLEQKSSHLENADEQKETRLTIAALAENELDDSDRAIAAYRLVLDADGSELRALRGLERLFVRKGRAQELVQILERQLEVVSTEKERIDILLRVARMWEVDFLKADLSAERLEQVLEIDPFNFEAFVSLERIYRGMQRWDDLVRTHERHAAATPDRTEKQRQFNAVGDVYHRELNDLDRGVDSYLNTLSIEPNDADALKSLSVLYTKRGDDSQAYDALAQLSRLVRDPVEVVDLRFRMGELLDKRLGDRVAAVDAYRSALDLEPGHLPSLAAMRGIYADSGDWLGAARVLRQEASAQPQARIASRLLVDLADIYGRRLDEREQAFEAYREAYEKDSENEEASYPLAERYLAVGDFASAYPLLDELVKRSSKREPEDQKRLAFLLGEAALQIGNAEAAVRALSKAHQIDAQDRSVLLLLSRAYYETQNWEQAFKFYQMVLVHHREDLSRDESVDVFYRLGVIKREQGDRKKAINMFDKALEEDSFHRPTLEALVNLYSESSEFEQVIHYKKIILELADPEERIRHLDEIGDLWNDRLKNPAKSLEAYTEASALSPKDHRLLHKMLPLTQSLGRWDEAIDVIQRISDLEERPDVRDQVRARYAYTIGVILRDEIKDVARALEFFDRSLDLDSSQLKAFEAINRVHTQQRDWKQLERAFRKMLKRITGKGNRDLEHNLWHNLGLIYRDRLKQPENAVEAFSVTTQLKPEDGQGHQILAELFTLMPGRTDNAVAEHQWLLKQEPTRIESYQALYKLYFDQRSYDKAWCVAAALSYMKQADREQQQFFEECKPRGLIRPTSRLDNERWLSDLTHADQDLVVSKIFAVLWPAVLAYKVKSEKDLGLSKKYEVDPAQSTVTMARTFGFVSQVLGVQTPKLYVRPDAPGGLVHLPSWPLSSLCGSTLLRDFQPQDLMFVTGRHLADYREEQYVRLLMPSNVELKTLLMAGLRIAGLIPEGDASVDQLAGQLAQKLQPPHVDALSRLGRRFLDAGARTDVKRWLQLAEVTACRAGFLVANDLTISANMIGALGTVGPVDLSPREKIQELVLFSVSEEYFRLREQLGLQIQIA